MNINSVFSTKEFMKDNSKTVQPSTMPCDKTTFTIHTHRTTTCEVQTNNNRKTRNCQLSVKQKDAQK